MPELIPATADTPAPRRVPLRSRLRLNLLFCSTLLLALLLGACATNRTMSERTPREPEQSEPTSSPSDAPPVEMQAEPTLGEQLGRLDALMRTATGDSLARLQEEYQRLLHQANGGSIQTGAAQNQTGGAQTPVTDTRAPQLKGLRPSERRFATGEAAGSPSTTPSAPRRNTSRPAPPRATGRSERPAPMATSTTRPVPKADGGTRERQKKLVDGLAAARAGNYPKATEDLPNALSGSLGGAKRTEAEYSYGLSLEKTGNLSKAAESYLKASRAKESLGHKSYISYCRVLARSGQRQRARQLLVEFIRKNPKSTQLVNARQLLQTM